MNWSNTNIEMPNERFRAIGARALEKLPQAQKLPGETRRALRVVSEVLPFRVNSHVTTNLIDWDSAPDDPIFRLVFPAVEMLKPADFSAVEKLLDAGASRNEITAKANEIRQNLNPHPSGQREKNVPLLDNATLSGFQHKYQETVLYFPARGQTCHAYCTFCFRWAQFVGDVSMKFSSKEQDHLRRYLLRHSEVTDVLITGGDPMIMSSHHIGEILSMLAAPDIPSLQTIRIGTKSLTFWPQRFVSDEDADDLLRSIERTSLAGKNVAIMVHVNHWRELDNPIAQDAVRRLRDAGATLHSQAPMLARINDSTEVWKKNWVEQTRMGIRPYYMFVERDTGPRHYFEVPLTRVFQIYREAIQGVSGLARTARGPVMSADPGKVEIIDAYEDGNEAIFQIQFLQARDAGRVRRPFYAKGPRSARWYDDLTPLDAESASKGILSGARTLDQ